MKKFCQFCVFCILWFHYILKSVPLGCVKYLKVFYKGDHVTIKTETIPLVWSRVFKMKNGETCIDKLPMVGKALVHLKKEKKAHSAGGKFKFTRNYFEEQRQIKYPNKKGHIENNSGFGTPVTELYRKVTEKRVQGSLLGCETQTVED